MASPDVDMDEKDVDDSLVTQLHALGVDTTGVVPDLAAKLCRCASLKAEGNALFAAGKPGVCARSSCLFGSPRPYSLRLACLLQVL